MTSLILLRTFQLWTWVKSGHRMIDSETFRRFSTIHVAVVTVKILSSFSSPILSGVCFSWLTWVAISCRVFFGAIWWCCDGQNGCGGARLMITWREGGGCCDEYWSVDDLHELQTIAMMRLFWNQGQWQWWMIMSRITRWQWEWPMGCYDADGGDGMGAVAVFVIDRGFWVIWIDERCINWCKATKEEKIEIDEPMKMKNEQISYANEKRWKNR